MAKKTKQRKAAKATKAKAAPRPKPRATGGSKTSNKGRSKPPAKPARRQKIKREAQQPKFITEENRGGHFFSTIKMWRLLHDDGGQTTFNKQKLAELFFAKLADEEDPEPEFVHAAITAELQAEFGDDFGDDLDEEFVDGPDDATLAAIEGPTPVMTGFRGGAAADETPPAGAGQKTSTPYKRIKEKHKRYVQRKIEALQKLDIGIEDVDEAGDALDEDAMIARREQNPRAERWYRYNPHGPWAEEFEKLLGAYGVIGADLAGLMAMRELIEDMQGTPLHKSLQRLLDRMMRCVPPELGDEARKQARVYRHSLGNTAKYLRKADDLQRWYAATLQRKQVVIDYTTPGESTRPRRLAALTTMFHREENSLYLLGSEKAGKSWSAVRQWKLDRVRAVRTTGLKNPPLAALPRHPLVRAVPDGGAAEQFDNDHAFQHSAGAWLEIDTTPTRLEVLVRVPVIGSRDGMTEKTRQDLQKQARRRAYGWMEWCQEKPFHPRQIPTLETTSSGEKQLRLVVEKCYVTEMASRLLRLQDCFEVVGPPELSNLISFYADAISACHGGQPKTVSPGSQ